MSSFFPTDPAAAVLTVSPLWLSPGDSVTLSCEVEHPSAGWRFYWYKTVPKLSDNSYIYELLPGSINGTEQDSYIIHGPTHTAGYMCRAGRGDPVYYTQYSKPGFVWSGGEFVCFSLFLSRSSCDVIIWVLIVVNLWPFSIKSRFQFFTKHNVDVELFYKLDWDGFPSLHLALIQKAH